MAVNSTDWSKPTTNSTNYSTPAVSSTGWGLSNVLVTDTYDSASIAYDSSTNYFDGYSPSQGEKSGVVNSTSWTAAIVLFLMLIWPILQH